MVQKQCEFFLEGLVEEMKAELFWKMISFLAEVDLEGVHP